MDPTVLGILGTLMGTVLGWVLNQVTHLGKLKVFVYGWVANTEDYGTSEFPNIRYKYSFSFEIYNSSASPKIMRDIKVLFYQANECIVDSAPYDSSTRRSTSVGIRHDLIFPINIRGKELQKYSVHSYVKDYQRIQESEDLRVFLSFKNERNRTKRVLVYKSPKKQ